MKWIMNDAKTIIHPHPPSGTTDPPTGTFFLSLLVIFYQLFSSEIAISKNTYLCKKNTIAVHMNECVSYTIDYSPFARLHKGEAKHIDIYS
jgi:hypothetical protein